MLPKTRKLTDSEIETVRIRCRELLDNDPNVSLSRIAAQVQFAESTISQFVSGKYTAKSDNVAHAINAWVERHRRRASSTKTRAYIPTWVCEQMIAAVRQAHRRERMCAITAPSGAGKDMVIDLLCEELNGFVINCHSKMTAVVLVRTIADRINMSSRRETCALMLARVSAKLRGQTATLFLNEAQTLPAECAGIVRNIYDDTDVPIIMFGSSGIFSFIDDRTSEAESGGGQFWRRCMKVNIVERMARHGDPDDPQRLGRPLYSKDEIREFVRMKQIKITDDAFEMLWRLACQLDRGALGLAHELVEGIVDLYGRGQTITEDLLFSQLFLESGAEADTMIAAADEWGERRIASAG